MIKARMEVLSGDPPCPGCLAILELADEYALKYKGKLDVIKLIGEEALAKFEEYRIGCVPAVVINGKYVLKAYTPAGKPWTMRSEKEVYEQDKS